MVIHIFDDTIKKKGMSQTPLKPGSKDSTLMQSMQSTPSTQSMQSTQSTPSTQSISLTQPMQSTKSTPSNQPTQSTRKSTRRSTNSTKLLLGPNTSRRSKHKRKKLRDNIQDITKFDFRRMARRGGVKRLSVTIYEESRGVLKVFLENIIRDTITITEHARRNTVMKNDVLYALAHQKRTLYF